jgi:hypothetical protein
VVDLGALVVPDDETLGAVAVDLAWRWVAWINRRVETIEFVEDTAVRRTVSVDFTFPAQSTLAAPVDSGTLIVVPLQILAKSTLMHVDVFDEDGKSLSTLNTDRNGELSGRGLVRFFDSLRLARYGLALPDDIRGELKIIARADPLDAWHRREELLSEGRVLADLLRVGPNELSVPPRPEVQLLNDLAQGFLQLVQVEYQPGVHRVLKVAYDVPRDWHEPDARLSDRVLRAIGGLPPRQTFSDLSIGQGMGYHVEVVAPEDTEIVETKLTGSQWNTQTDQEQPADLEAQVTSRSRAHVHVGLLAGSEGASDADELERKRVLGRNDIADITVAFLARRSGVATAAPLASTLASAVMVIFATRLSHLDGQTSAAVLLLVPVIVGAYLGRAGEHPFATRMLLGVRVLALVVSIPAVVLSAMIGAGFMKLERAPADHRSPTTRTEPGQVAGARCSITSRPRGSRGRRAFVPEDLTCSLIRERVAVAPAPALRVNPTVRRVSWALAGLSLAATVVLWLGYGLATYVRRTAAS